MQWKDAKNVMEEDNSDINKDPPPQLPSKKVTNNFKTRTWKAFLVEHEEKKIKAMQELQASQKTLLEKITRMLHGIGIYAKSFF